MLFLLIRTKNETRTSFHLLGCTSLPPSVIAVLAPGVQDPGSLVSSAAAHQPINHLLPPRAALTARLCCSAPHLQVTLLFCCILFLCFLYCLLLFVSSVLCLGLVSSHFEGLWLLIDFQTDSPSLF